MQALGLGIYLSLVSALFLKGNELFGRVPNYWGPLLFLFLFVTSALVSAILVLGYPFILFWQKKQLEKAIRLVIYTTAWLIGFIILLLLLIFLSKN
ncbi:hypothetical protein A2164_04185 [Candidatus Curtissbacteria bacterium RBG_13_35_7]|uniref:Uncharacterized protein n=1 Tax=Candidatus Curtissbacteria bacterium RBG_13_35_7 TaxID=1797705 RepID=A0A1F5G554_9BACT|nr:MAG: hypothetical protein A2164_04185 [Candidatus Curtissbacteria bacterium RBG_13_35_7]